MRPWLKKTLTTLSVVGVCLSVWGYWLELRPAMLLDFYRVQESTWFGELKPNHSPTFGSNLPDAGTCFGGFPVYKDETSLRLLRNHAYTVGYDTRRRNPAWVAYRVFALPPAEKRAREEAARQRPEHFTPDFRLLTPTSPSRYTRSGFDRGHMAPHFAIATHYPEVTETSFLTSNIIPQSPPLNQGLWRELEMRITRQYANKYEEVWVIVGPAYSSPGKRVDGWSEVPTDVYCILVDMLPSGTPRTLAFLIPNSPPTSNNLRDYITTVQRIEDATGLRFFPALDQTGADYLRFQKSVDIW